MEKGNKEHEAVTLVEDRAMAAAPVSTLRDRRIQAAAIFGFFQEFGLKNL
jgi:hypothetical protein